MAAVFDVEALRELARSPADSNGFSALGSQPFVLVDAALDPTEKVADWLRTLPCPVIGIGSAETRWSRAYDVVVSDVDDAEPLIDNIRRHPLAATVLVQLLRAIEFLPMTDALVAESLAYASLQGGAEFRRWLASRPAMPPSVSDPGPAVLLERDGDVLHMQLNRPSNRNAMSVEMRDALLEALRLVLVDERIAEVRVSGRGKCFSTGGDLAEFGSAPDPATAHLVRSLALPGRLLAQCASRVRVDLHGACIGSGIEFPAFAGKVFAVPGTWFQLPELKYGLIPGAGGCVSVARRIGRQRTTWLVLSGARIDARTALDWGLVDAIA